MAGSTIPCEVKLELLCDGTICAAAMVRGEHVYCERPLSGPAEALDWLERALEPYRGGTINLLIRKTEGSEARWTSQSSSLALMWLATVLGDAWNPGFRVTSSVADRAASPHATGTRLRTGKLVLSEQTGAQREGDADEPRGDGREDVA